MNSRPVKPWSIWWGDLGSKVGREQEGLRPLIVISSQNFNELVSEMVLIVPCTSVNRNWPNHVRITGNFSLKSDSYAMTEQLQSISRQRLLREIGEVDKRTEGKISVWINRWLA